MRRLKGKSVDDQTAEDQLEVLQWFENGDEISVTLEEKGSISGPVTSVVENGPSENLEEVHVQFQNFDSGFRHDDSGHHTVSITRTDNGGWEKADLTYSWTDTGRVRRKTVDTVEHVWPSVSEVLGTTVLSREEANILVMREMGLSKEEIAEWWNCEEMAVKAVLADIRDTYRRAERTMDRLESSPIDLDGRTFLSMSMFTDDSGEDSK
ncbi:hypothetical protein [Halorussus sp. AFM4]|uniref:hypothetical protein n=1 Tax=Halorussus sp. AFM4 TaxID=3421651 RepID=UPI003EBF488D